MKISDKRAKLLSAELPENLIDFLDSKEYKRLAGYYIYNIPDRTYDTKEKLLIDEEKLEFLYEYSHGDYYNGDIKYCPIYTFKDGSYYFGVDVSKEELPVVFFDYEAGISIYSESLAIFLKIPLAKKKDLTPLEALVEEYYKTDDTFENEDFDKVILHLKRILEKKVPDRLLKNEEYVILISWVNYRLAHCYYNLADYENAEVYYKAAAKDGWSIAYFDLCELFKYALYDTEKLKYYSEKIAREYHVFKYVDYDDEHAYEKAWFIPKINFAYLHITNKNTQEALKLYREIAEKEAELKQEFIDEIKEDLKYLKKEKLCSTSDYKEILSVLNG